MTAMVRAGLVGLLLVAASAPLAAQHRPAVVRGPRGNQHVAHPRARFVFRTTDRVLFRNYYRTHRIVITPLRPELARLVIVGKPLPVEIIRTPVPHELVVTLAAPPAGYQYVVVGNRVVILDDEGDVSDILDDVFEKPTP